MVVFSVQKKLSVLLLDIEAAAATMCHAKISLSIGDHQRFMAGETKQQKRKWKKGSF